MQGHAAALDDAEQAIAVVGARGGVGASTIATSVAWLLADKEKRSTALLDLDVHFGTGALSLDLEPGRGLTDAIENPSRIDGLFIERAMVKASEKLSVLSAEAPINAPLMTDGAAFYQLQEEMCAAFDCTIVDLPRGMLVQHPHLISEVHLAVLVTDLTLAAARDTIRADLERTLFVEAGAGSGKTAVLVDRVVALAAGDGSGSPVPMRNIAAITFTEKAAGELRAFSVNGVTEVHGDVNGDGQVDICVKLSGTLRLSAQDFIL